MTVLSLFPSRIRWTDANGFLTNEAYRALQIMLERLGGVSTDTTLRTLQEQLDTLVLDDLVDVEITSATANDVLVYGGTLWENKGPVLARDALGLGTGSPTNGQLLIGNGTDFSTSSLTTGDGITATTGPGTLNLAANLTEGDGILITPSSGALIIETDLIKGAGIALTTDPNGQITVATNLTKGDGIALTTDPTTLQITVATNLVKGAGVALTTDALTKQTTVATNLAQGTGINLSTDPTTQQITINTSLAAGANINITGTTTRTIAVTGLGSMAFQSTGASGSFLSADTPAKTVTVSNGIITAIT